LQKHYIDEHGKTKRNLISLCHNCHEIEHGYRQQTKELLTEERW
jgi:predicted HNH restriction endonuclease